MKKNANPPKWIVVNEAWNNKTHWVKYLEKKVDIFILAFFIKFVQFIWGKYLSVEKITSWTKTTGYEISLYWYWNMAISQQTPSMLLKWRAGARYVTGFFDFVNLVAAFLPIRSVRPFAIIFSSQISFAFLEIVI